MRRWVEIEYNQRTISASISAAEDEQSNTACTRKLVVHRDCSEFVRVSVDETLVW